MTTSIAADPASRTPSQWAGRLAAYLSRGVPDNDPRVIECREALSYWRVRRTLDLERNHLSPAHVPELVDLMRHAHPAVPA